MTVEKDVKIFTASETVKQVRNALKLAFPDKGISVFLKRNDARTTITVQWKEAIPSEDIEKKLKTFIGFIDIHAGLRLPLWHKKGKGTYHHYQVDCFKYKNETWKEIIVTQEEKSPSWRFWRLTPHDFETNLKPYLNRWKQENKDILYSIIVENKVQSEVASSSGITRQAINKVVKSAFKIYMEANAKPQKQPTSEKE